MGAFGMEPSRQPVQHLFAYLSNVLSCHSDDIIVIIPVLITFLSYAQLVYSLSSNNVRSNDHLYGIIL